MGLSRELGVPRYLDEDPARGGQPQERREARLFESGSWPRAPAVIDDDPYIGSFKKREHVHDLVALDLEIDEHAQVGQFGQQPGGLRVILHSQ